jgi:hypothetical protein
LERYANNDRQIYSTRNWRYLGSMGDDAQACQLHVMAKFLMPPATTCSDGQSSAAG